MWVCDERKSCEEGRSGSLKLFNCSGSQGSAGHLRCCLVLQASSFFGVGLAICRALRSARLSSTPDSRALRSARLSSTPAPSPARLAPCSLGAMPVPRGRLEHLASTSLRHRRTRRNTAHFAWEVTTSEHRISLSKGRSSSNSKRNAPATCTTCPHARTSCASRRSARLG